jgi:hypothetical protein
MVVDFVTTVRLSTVASDGNEAPSQLSKSTLSWTLASGSIPVHLGLQLDSLACRIVLCRLSSSRDSRKCDCPRRI